MTSDRKFRVVQTVAVYIYADDEVEAREEASKSTANWDDWELEIPIEDSYVEEIQL